MSRLMSPFRSLLGPSVDTSYSDWAFVRIPTPIIIAIRNKCFIYLIEIRSQLCLPFKKEGSNFLKTLDNFKPFVRFFIFFKEFLCSFDGIFLLPQQVVDQVEVFDVYRPEITVSLFILTRLEDVEFGLPEAEQGLVDPKHLRDLSHCIILFAEQDLVGRDFDQVRFCGDLF